MEKAADMFYGLAALLRVARPVGKEEGVEVQRVEVVVPRHAHHLDIPFRQTTNDVRLHAAVHQDHTSARSFIISNDILAAHLLHPVHRPVVLRLQRSRFVARHHLPTHHSVLPQQHGQPACVDAAYGRNALTSQPFLQRLLGIPVAVLLAVVRHHQRLHVDPFGLHEPGQRLSARFGHTVVAHKRVGHHQYLACIARIGQALGITRHGCVEHDLADSVTFGTERPPAEHSAVVQYQFRFFLHSLYLFL